MKLLSLKLLHYRRFRQEEIIFKDDFSLIFWKNGAGKSSVLDAIWYTLFWPSSKDFVRVNRDYLRSYFLKEREPSKVELTFQYGMENYRIVRIIDAGTKKFASEFIIENKDTLIWPNGIEIIGWDEITSYIEELIWVNKETFLRSVFARQKDLEVLSGGLSERKELINKVLGLDRIEHIIEELKKEEKEKKLLLEMYKKKVWDFDGESLKTQKEALQNQINEISQKYQISQQKKKELLLEYEKVKLSFEQNGNKKNLFTQISQDISIKNEQIKNLEKNILDKTQELSDIEKKEKYLEENKDIISKKEKYDVLILEQENLKNQYKIKKDLETELQKVLKDIEIAEEKNKQYSLEKIQKEIEIVQKSLEDLQQKLNTNIGLKASLGAELSQMKTMWEEVGKELKILQDLWQDASCPTCKRPLKEDFPHLIALFEKDLWEKRKIYASKFSALNVILWEIPVQEKALSDAKNELKILQNKEKDILLFQNQIQNDKNKQTEILKKLSSLQEVDYKEENHQKIKLEFELINKTFQEYNKVVWQVLKKSDILVFLETSSQNKEIFQKELQTFQEKLKILDFQVEIYEKSKREFEIGNEKIHILNQELSEIEKVKLTYEFDMKAIIKKEEDFLEDKKQIEIYVENVSQIVFKKQILSDYILYLLAHLKPRVEDLASEYFSLITDGKYTSLSLDEDYNILIDEKNLDLYSWWERDLANLCFRLSLGQNLTSNKWNPINFLVLDEVLASQDKERQQNILIHLKKLENKFSQIILISHLEEIKDLATNLIEIKAKNREESEVNYY